MRRALLVIAMLGLGSLAGAGETLRVVINEFGQGVSHNAEWVELLVVGTGLCSTVDLRGYRLVDREGYLGRSFPTRVVFRSIPAWAAVPAGTLIVIYNGNELPTRFPPNFPFSDLDFSDHRVSIPHTNTDFFENVAWGGFGNGGDYVVLLDSALLMVDGLSYGSLGTDPSLAVHLAAVEANTAAWFTGGSTALINDSAHWATGSESGGASTPGAPNGGANTTWRSSLLPRPVISVAPSAHGFGTVLVGGESAPLTVTVGNTGCANLAVGTVTLTGADPGEFELRNDGVSGATIPPTGSRTLQVVFKPTSPGAKAAALRIPSNDPANPLVSVSLSGTGQVPPLSVSAGGPYVGVVGVPLTLQATASGGLPPYTFAWDLDGDGAYDDAAGSNVAWTWALPGIYTVGVRVSDSLGGQATAGATVRIFPAKGDVNGDGRIDLVDLRLAHQAALGLLVLSPEERDRADINGNGVVDMEDVTLICQMILGGCG